MAENSNVCFELHCEHIGLAAPAPKDLAAWYQATFGLQKELKGDSEKGPYFLLDAKTGFIVEIFYQEQPVPSNSVHFCFHVSDIRGAIAALPSGTPEVAPLRTQDDTSQVYFFKDPVGHTLQFSQR